MAWVFMPDSDIPPQSQATPALHCWEPQNKGKTLKRSLPPTPERWGHQDDMSVCPCQSPLFPFTGRFHLNPRQPPPFIVGIPIIKGNSPQKGHCSQLRPGGAQGWHSSSRMSPLFTLTVRSHLSLKKYCSLTRAGGGKESFLTFSLPLYHFYFMYLPNKLRGV